MSRLILFTITVAFCVCLQISFAFSQDFGSVGTTWHYTLNHFSDPGIDYVEVASIGDTTIYNHACHHLQVVHGYDCYEMYTNTFVYEENEIVYYFVSTMDQFAVLYNFNLQADDTLKIYVNGFFGNLDSTFLKITAVSSDTINGVPLKGIATELLSGNYTFSTTNNDTILERIGADYLFPQYLLCEAAPSELRCFEDSLIGFYTTNIAPTCDYISTGISDINPDQQNFKIVSNPFSDQLKFSFINDKEKFSVIISDVTGRKFFTEDNLNPDFVIETSSWPSEIYFLTLNQENNSQTFKVIKQ